ncbi:transglutaminase-like domain-containing protein [Zavarzinia sp. CC-PAN008]|uniref:transglutaminase-like domain-containing protein n=1 Tax=Zavarzinia sp. CC-PAN008 TaxID=3243332 RepID=UPI003F7472A4
MKIRLGFDIGFELPHQTAMVLTLNVHQARRGDLIVPDTLRFQPTGLPVKAYRDSFGNWCTRIVAGPGPFRVSTDALIQDSGQPDRVNWDARQHDVHDLPEETLVYLLGSRYCETDLLSEFAWNQFGHIQGGWARVQAIVDFVHNHIEFGYPHARCTRTAWEGFQEKRGVCRDFAHLAIALTRCMNIPARYCTGYLGDIGVPPVDCPMDFSGWFEAYIGGDWYTFDARHNTPRIGRVPIAYGRDASDVAISTSYGRAALSRFVVWTDEVSDAAPVPLRLAS